MKKIYTLITALAFTFGVSAQNRAMMPVANNVHSHSINIQKHQLSQTNRANGDTLMWLPLLGAYVMDSTNNFNFKISIEDIDGLPTNNAGYDPDFGIYYSDDTSGMAVGHPWQSNYYHPYENPVLAGGTDSTFFWHATSWFNPAGQANNWLMFGPITIPSSGASMKWYDKCNPAYRDGYKVYVTTTTSAADSASFVDFNDPAIFTRPDAFPDPTYALDTTWQMRSVNIPATYSGQTVWFGFNHNANDMDVLYLDDFTVVEGPLGIEENEFVNGVRLFQNMPNPFNSVSTISYELKEKAAVSLSIYDVTGKKVTVENQGEQSSGIHSIKFNASNLSAGVYYYSLSVGSNATACKKMVVIK